MIHRTNRHIFRAAKVILWISSLLFFVVSVGCGSETPAAPIVATATPVVAPTPTLAPEITITEIQTQITPTNGSESAPVTAADPSPGNPSVEEEENEAVSSSADVQDEPTVVQAIPLDLPPDELLPAAAQAFDLGNFQHAANLYRFLLEGEEASSAQIEAAWLGLGQAQLEMGQRISALETFAQYLTVSENPDSRVYFWQAVAEPDPISAAAYYRTYLEENPDMVTYIEPRIAALLPSAAEASLLAALEGEAHYLVLVDIRQQLADLYLTQSRYAEAIEQYSAIRDLARTEITRGDMTYLIGQAYLLAGDEENALAAYAFGVDNYPSSYSSYQGLVALVEAGRPVNGYQRGVIDYYAKAYVPAVEALTDYIANAEPLRPDAYLFLAWSYEGVGNTAQALTALDQYLALDSGNPAVIGTHIEEKAALLTRSVSTSQAIDALQTFTRQHPEHPLVPWALYRSGVLADRFRQDAAQAIPLYENFAAAYPEHPQASEAIFRVGMLHYEQSNLAEALSFWQQASAYGDEFGRASLVWLIRSSQPAEAAAFKEQAAGASGGSYYTLRARDIGLDQPPYPTVEEIDLEFDEAAAQLEVESWIRSHFGLAEDAAVSSTLDPAIANDPRMLRGEKLWELGLKSEAKRELEAVREQFAENAQLSYQLALYFRDLGLYRSSILAAGAVLNRGNISAFDAPTLIGRLAYPVYYSDLILPLADEYGYDPLLQFAQIRQESLFESFITSVAAAQGLTQIIPDTGQYIANRLQWPNYQVSDLNRPYINLEFGAYYLDQQLALFEGSIAPALAAYNAGPGNAIGWYELAGDDHDLYLETVNFSETRLYIRRIYVGQAIYRHLYEKEDTVD